MLDSDAESAKTLTLVALILQVVFFAIALVVILVFSVFAVSASSSAGTGVVTTTSFAVSGILAAFLSIFAGVGILWIILDYLLIYKPLSEENVQRAETPALVLSILQIIFGGIITGILLLVAYIKIKDSLNSQKQLRSSSNL